MRIALPSWPEMEEASDALRDRGLDHWGACLVELARFESALQLAEDALLEGPPGRAGGHFTFRSPGHRDLQLPDVADLGVACDALLERGLDAPANVFVRMVRQRRRWLAIESRPGAGPGILRMVEAPAWRAGHPFLIVRFVYIYEPGHQECLYTASVLGEGSPLPGRPSEVR
jgi:hypothetical protein